MFVNNCFWVIWMDEATLKDWLDQHHVEVIRTHATNLDGHAIGKCLSRDKFLKSLPAGHTISDMSLASDFTGTPHATVWHEMRHGQFGDILMQPDLSTLTPDGTDPDLGHVVCDFTSVTGEAISLCPRSLLRRLVNEVDSIGYQVRASFELEFLIYRNSFDEARQKGYRNLDPATASTAPNVYLLRNTHHVKAFMNEVVGRMNRQKFAWEAWHDEGGIGQVEMNFPPADPMDAADKVARVRQLIYEVAVDLNMAVTFMPMMQSGYGNGLHIHHSLLNRDDSPAFHAGGQRSELMNQWIAGIVATMPGATSILCPSFNAYRRLRDFTSPPVIASWGEENKTACLRAISRDASLTRLEHRLPGGDANPYLALAVILAGGLAGCRHKLTPPPELRVIGWGLPDDVPRLPNNILLAADALARDEHLPEMLGQDFIDYWIDSRKLEWLTFHKESGDATATRTTDWEYFRYFQLL